MPDTVKIVLIAIGACIGLLLSVLIIYLLVIIISSLFVNKNKIYDKHSRYYRALLNSFSGFAKWVLGVRMHVTGMDKFSEAIPKGRRFLIVQNHRSNFDPILTWLVLKKHDVAFISKEKNMHIPFFGRIIRRCCFMSIDRENAREALKTIIKGAELIKDDQVSIGIYPEGTRNKAYTGLLPFHNGVFKIAQLAKVPIVITTIYGTENVSKNYLRRHTDVYMDITGVISAEDVAKMSTKDIAAIAEKQMLEQLDIRDAQANESSVGIIS